MACIGPNGEMLRAFTDAACPDGVDIFLSTVETGDGLPLILLTVHLQLGHSRQMIRSTPLFTTSSDSH